MESIKIDFIVAEPPHCCVIREVTEIRIHFFMISLELTVNEVYGSYDWPHRRPHFGDPWYRCYLGVNDVCHALP